MVGILFLALACQARTEPEPPVVKNLTKMPAPDGRVTLDLTREGEVYCQRIWPRTLDELAKLLNDAVRSYDKQQRAAGRSGFEVVDGKKVSRLPLLIVADRRAVWRHMQWVLTVCAEQRIRRVQFAARAGKTYGWFETFLPFAPATEPDVQVHIEPVKFEDRAIGPPQYRQNVRVPVRCRYWVGQRASADLGDVRRWAKGASVATVRATPNVSFQQVVSVLQELDGLKRIEFFTQDAPSAKVRKKPFLPFGRTKPNPPQKK